MTTKKTETTETQTISVPVTYTEIGGGEMTVRVTEAPLLISPAADRDTITKTTADYWVKHISANWQKATESIIKTGQLLIGAKDDLDRGAWGKLFEEGRLPFSQSTADKLMAIARNKVLANSEHVRNLPPSWGTLYELTKLPTPTLKAKIADGTITPKLERKDVAKLTKKPGADKAKHKAKMAPIVRLKEERDELERVNADLEERLTSAEADAAAKAMELPPSLAHISLAPQTMAVAIIDMVGEEKAKAIAAAILQRFKRKPGRPAKAGKDVAA